MAKSAVKRILIVNRHFAPDLTTYAEVLRHIARRWVEDGHVVHVATTRPHYRPEVDTGHVPWREQREGMEIFRLPIVPFRRQHIWKRLVNTIPFFIGLFWHMLRIRIRDRQKYDYLLAATNPPIIEAMWVWLLGLLLGGKLIYHVQDIHPEVEGVTGVVQQQGWRYRLMRRLDAVLCWRAEACVTLSEDMRRILLARYPTDQSLPTIHVINNFIFSSPAAESSVPAEYRKASDRFRVIFAGNIGFFQGLDVMVEAMHRLTDTPDIELVLVGGGIATESLKEQAGHLRGNSIRFIPMQPFGVAEALVREADLAIISLKPGVIRMAYPSKTMTYVDTGTTLLAMVEPDSQLGQTIREHNLGWVVGQKEDSTMADVIREAYSQRQTLQKQRGARQQIGRQLFGAPQALDAWSDLLAAPRRST